MPKRVTVGHFEPQSTSGCGATKDAESFSSDDDLGHCIDAIVRQLQKDAQEEPILRKITLAERCRRQDAVDFARASMALEGFKTSVEWDTLALRFIEGDIDIAEFSETVRRSLHLPSSS